VLTPLRVRLWPKRVLFPQVTEFRCGCRIMVYYGTLPMSRCQFDSDHPLKRDRKLLKTHPTRM
jgi:hypothetical protein